MLKKTIYLINLLVLFLASDLLAQCWPEGLTHDTRPGGQWLSCRPAPSPNPVRGDGIWILYDLGYRYDLGPTTIWNYNEPGFLPYGITRLQVDYSLDGVDWTDGGTYDLRPSSGRRDEAGQAGPDLSGVEARYLLFTAVANGENQMSCAGLAEVRFDLQSVTTPTEAPVVPSRLEVFPNPSAGQISVRLPKTSIQALYLYDPQGRELNQWRVDDTQMAIELGDYPPGIYLLRAVGTDGTTFQERLTKI